MIPRPDNADPIWELIDAVCIDGASDKCIRQLEARLRDDPVACDLYNDYCELHAALILHATNRESFAAFQDTFRASVPHAPLAGLIHGATSYLTQGVPFWCLTTLMLIGIVVSVLSLKSPPPAIQSVVQRHSVPVGHITGLVGCDWAKDAAVVRENDEVTQGQEFKLESGILEISYDTGAKVTLQGPVAYTVESNNGGFLAVGKLTGKMLTKAARGFSVRTPTAVVVDLGTEFGVKVDRNGATESHVFAGLVRVVPMFAATGQPQAGTLLHAGEAASVSAESVATTAIPANEQQFVRELPPKPAGDAEAYAKLVLSLQPVVYYRMERPKANADPMQVIDSAPGGYHGAFGFDKMALKDVAYAPGRFGESLLFRGATAKDHVIVPDYPKAEHDQLSVSVWVMALEHTDYAAIVSNWGEGVRGRFYFGLNGVGSHSPYVHIQDRDGKSVCLPIFESEERNRPLPLLTWQHVAFVVDGNIARLYRDGVEIGSTPCRGLLAVPTVRSLAIGCQVDKHGQVAFNSCWHGCIDELAVFHRALPPEAIRELAKASGQRSAGN